ncbi:hypothetical protein P8452_58758 [Trifolium repens]|nr:hypothetical protein P8452_58758 [Trifolium repens]
MNPNHRRSRRRKFLIGNVPSPPLFSILAPILLPSFTVLPFVSIFELPYEFLQPIFDAILMRVVVKMFTFTELWLMAVVQFVYQLLFQKNKIGQILLGPHMGRLIYGTCRFDMLHIYHSSLLVEQALGKCQLGDEVRKKGQLDSSGT